MTGKLVLISPGDPFNASGITTLAVSPPGSGLDASILIKMYTQTIATTGSFNSAFISSFYPPADTTPHLQTIQGLVEEGTTWMASSSQTVTSPGLGYTGSVLNPNLTKADFQAALPNHSIIYYMGFGASAVKDVSPLTGIKCWEAHGLDWDYDNIIPGDVTLANTVGGKLVHHKLVFLNACL